jgi:hypothetical protein
LTGREHLGEQVFELDFAPRAARGDVAENTLQVPNAGCEMPHFAKSAVDLFEALADQAERFAEPGFERGLELLIDCGPHFVQALADGFANTLEFGACVALGIEHLAGGLTGKALNTGSYFFTQGAALFRLALGQAGKVFAQARFGLVTLAEPAQQEEIESGKNHQSCQDRPKHFRFALF